MTDEQYEFLVGNLLGDGSLSKLTDKSKNSLFEIKQKLNRSEYIKYLFKKYKPFSKKYTEGKSKKPVRIKGKIVHNLGSDYCYWCKLRTISHPCFTVLRNKWYIIKNNKSKKIIPRDLKITWRAAASWACDDGYNHDGRTFRLYTDCFSTMEVKFLLKIIKRDLGLIGKINFRKTRPTIVFCGDNAFNFMDGIKQFVPNCYKYKTLNRLSKYKPRKVK